MCDAGFALSGATCVPLAQCGCLLEGHYFEPGTPVPPPGPASTTLSPCCHCHPGGRVACAPCQVAQDQPGLCLAWGRLGYRTFDGATFHLPDSCTPLLVGVSSSPLRGLWPFQVTLERGPESGPAHHVLLHVQGHRFLLHCQDWGYLTVSPPAPHGLPVCSCKISVHPHFRSALPPSSPSLLRALPGSAMVFFAHRPWHAPHLLCPIPNSPQLLLCSP